METRAEIDVRKAKPGELTAITGTLAAAFKDDPVMTWWIEDDADRAQVLPGFFGLALDAQYFRHDEVYGTDGLESVAAWVPPNLWKASEAEFAEMAPRYLEVISEKYFERGALILALVEEVHPEESHWYLPFIGTRPDRQGQGLGSALLAHMTERLDRDGRPAYLEASTERNRALYLRHGFEVTGEIRLPDGPTMWSMWRPARSL